MQFPLLLGFSPLHCQNAPNAVKVCEEAESQGAREQLLPQNIVSTMCTQASLQYFACC